MNTRTAAPLVSQLGEEQSEDDDDDENQASKYSGEMGPLPRFSSEDFKPEQLPPLLLDTVRTCAWFEVGHVLSAPSSSFFLLRNAHSSHCLMPSLDRMRALIFHVSIISGAGARRLALSPPWLRASSRSAHGKQLD